MIDNPLWLSLRNVMEGRTCDGAPYDGKTIPYFSDVAKMLPLAKAAHDLHHFCIGHGRTTREADITATILVRKMLHYAVRKGPDYISSNPFEMDIIAARVYLLHRMECIPDAMGFRRYARLGYDYLRQQLQTPSVVLAREHAKHIAATPLPMVVWSSGPTTLHELTDPVHIYDEGIRLENCLASHFRRSAYSLHNVRYPDSLKHLTYAYRVKTGRLRLFSLRKGSDRIACFSLRGGVVDELMHRPGITEAERELLLRATKWAAHRPL